MLHTWANMTQDTTNNIFKQELDLGAPRTRDSELVQGEDQCRKVLKAGKEKQERIMPIDM